MKYHVVVGLEMHCEMKSNSKVFAPSKNSYEKGANVNVDEVTLAFPGSLPTVNKKCVEKAIKAALMLNCKIPNVLVFDRKNYYYPDLPKGYQITQSAYPIGTDGFIEIETKDGIKRVLIEDIHLEEDSAALDHLESMSLIDYNRAGVPLLECVTKPCIYSSDDAASFVESMIRMYQYSDISDADTKKGQIRCDVNVNIQDENGNFVTPKVEVKNVNSIGNIKKTIDFEFERQLKALENGENLTQETRRFDEETESTVFMRSKADALDYKYFTEPNIPPFEITNELINNIKKEIPVLFLERKIKYKKEYNLDEVSASSLVKTKTISDYFEKCVSIGIEPKIASNYINGLIIAYLYANDIKLDDFYLIPEYLKQIIDAISSGKISSKQGKEIFAKSLEEHKEPVNFLTSDVSQISDEAYLEEIIVNIMQRSSQQITDYHAGRTNLFDYFVGQVMKETKGKANPVITKELIAKYLNK